MKNNLSYKRIILSVVISFVITALLIIFFARNDIIKAAAKTDWLVMPVAILFALFSFFALSSSFWLIARAFHINAPTPELYKIGFTSVALGNVVAFGGIPEFSLRVVFLRPYNIEISRIIAPSLFHSFIKDGIYMAGFPAAFFYLLSTHVLSQAQVGGFALVTVIGAIIVLVNVLSFS